MPINTESKKFRKSIEYKKNPELYNRIREYYETFVLTKNVNHGFEIN